MKKIAIIPARYASSRFPGKPLIDLMGKTMIQHVYDRVNQSGLFNKVVVATDDKRIEQEVMSFGGEVVLTRSDHRSGTDRCGEVIDVFPDFDVVVNVQGDEPLVDPNQLDELLNAFQDEQVEIATLGTPRISAEEIANANRIKVVLDAANNALYFSRSPIPFERNETTYPFLKHIGLYGFRTKTLRQLIAYKPTKLEETESLEQLRWLYYGHQIRVVETVIETPNIDVPADVDRVLQILTRITHQSFK
jgi:3-deoxy-manno-octulosonate cytidylyltransferase (CMP-KDO synthetase)